MMNLLMVIIIMIIVVPIVNVLLIETIDTHFKIKSKKEKKNRYKLSIGKVANKYDIETFIITKHKVVEMRLYQINYLLLFIPFSSIFTKDVHVIEDLVEIESDKINELNKDNIEELYNDEMYENLKKESKLNKFKKFIEVFNNYKK